MKFFSFILLILPTLGIAAPHFATSQRELTHYLKQIYQEHRFTFFCEQAFSENYQVSYRPCASCPALTQDIQWMTIVPPQTLAKNFLCFQEKICLNQQSKRFKGLLCCKQKEPRLQKMMRDLHNLVPEIPQLKQQRKNYTFKKSASPLSSTCSLQVDNKNKVIELPPPTLGLIARTYLYMHHTYHFELSATELATFLSWHQQWPPTAWEQARNQKILLLQGTRNPYIS